MQELKLKLTPEQAVALLNLLQAEQDYEGYLPETLEEVKEALRTWLKEKGLARKSPTGGYYLVRKGPGPEEPHGGLLPGAEVKDAAVRVRRKPGLSGSFGVGAPKRTRPKWKPMKTAIFDRAKALLTNVYPVNAQTYLVKSQRGEGVYRVDLEASTCTCPAYTYGFRPCKHLLAATLYKKLRRNGSSHSSQAKTETSG